MSYSTGKDPTAFFSVVGSAYVRGTARRLPRASFGPASRRAQSETGVAGLWLIFYAVIAGAALFQPRRQQIEPTSRRW